MQSRDVKKCLIVGATGRVGSMLLKLVIEKGFHAVCLVRDPSKLQVQSQQITIIEGDLFDGISFKKGLQDVDVVFSCFGLRKPPQQPRDDKKRAAEVYVKEMTNSEVKRIILVAGAGILKLNDENDIMYQDSSRFYQLMINSSRDNYEGYKLLQQSDPDFTLFCPGEIDFTTENQIEFQAEYYIGFKEGIIQRTSGIQIAKSMVDEFEQKRFSRNRVSIQDKI